MLNLGVRAHDFGKLPAETLASKISAHGLTGIQLALARAIDGINSDTGAQSPGLANGLRQAFGRHNIRVAVLGCYVNICHPDLNERAALIRRFKEHLRFVRDFGCSVVATETASLNADWSFHPDNTSDAAFKIAMDSVATLVEEAERFGVFCTIEGVAHHVVSTPQKIKRMLDSIQSNNLQILFDPVNLLNAANYKDQDRIIQESFDLFGDRMIIIHAKDFVIEDGKYRQVCAGHPQGLLNYPLLTSLLKQKKTGIDILLEDTSPDTIATSIARLKSFY